MSLRVSVETSRSTARSWAYIYATITALTQLERTQTTSQRFNSYPWPSCYTASRCHQNTWASFCVIRSRSDSRFEWDFNFALCIYARIQGGHETTAGNSGFMAPLANRGCAKYLFTKNQKANLAFNAVLNARHRHLSLLKRIRGEQRCYILSEKGHQKMGKGPSRKGARPLC